MEFVLEEHRVSCLVPTSGGSRPWGQFWEIWSQYQFGLKQPIFSYQLLRDDGGAISLAQRGVGTCRYREHREPLSVGLGAPWFPGTRLWLGGTPLPLAEFQGPD